VSNFRLNIQLHLPCDAFLRGFSEVIPAAWITMFAPAELQLLLGGSDAPLDVWVATIATDPFAPALKRTEVNHHHRTSYIFRMRY
jgi:hypothetical protein